MTSLDSILQGINDLYQQLSLQDFDDLLDRAIPEISLEDLTYISLNNPIHFAEEFADTFIFTAEDIGSGIWDSLTHPDEILNSLQNQSASALEALQQLVDAGQKDIISAIANLEPESFITQLDNNDTAIRMGDELLATLNAVDANLITQDDFFTVG